MECPSSELLEMSAPPTMCRGRSGQVTGSIPLGAVQSPVSATVSWTVFDSDHTPLAANQFVAPIGLSSPSASFIFLPPIVQAMIGMDLTPVSRFIRATVTLTVGPVSSGPVALPDISVSVVPLPIPTIFSLFRFVDFRAMVDGNKGTVLVVVPSASLLKTFGDVQSSLTNLQSVVSQLSAFVNFATFATRLNMLVSALNSIAALDQSPITRVFFQAADSFPDLQNFVYERSFGSWGWITLSAEDSMSALIFVGSAGRTMECTNARSFNASAEGQFTVMIGGTAAVPDMFVTVRDLDGTVPPNDPGTSLTVTAAPPGSNVFSNNLSSLRFTA